MSPVGAAARVRDLAAVVLLVGGVALYGFAALRVREMADAGLQPPPGVTHVQETERRMAPLTAVSRLGLALAALGVGVGVWSYARHRASTSESA